MCLCLTLVPYGKPILRVYILYLTGCFFVGKYVHTTLVHACLIIYVIREKSMGVSQSAVSHYLRL